MALKRGILALAAAAVTAVVMAPSAGAVPAAGVDQTGMVVATFDTGNLGSFVTHPITGLQPGEKIADIDSSPTNGLLFGLGISRTVPDHDTGRLYTLDPTTGVATPVAAGATPFANSTLNDAPNYGFDVRPTAPSPLAIRLVDEQDKNLRINGDTGGLLNTDSPLDLIGGAEDIVSIAYDRNFAGAPATGLFGIDPVANTMVQIGGADGVPSPDGGVMTTKGPLGVTFGDKRVGFDIDSSGVAWVTGIPQPSSLPFLFTANLSTGHLTQVGTLPFTIGDFAVRFPAAATTPPGSSPPPTTTRRKRCRRHRSRAATARKKCKRRGSGK